MGDSDLAEKMDPAIYAEKVKMINPKIILDQEYSNMHTSIPCHCSSCGYGKDGAWIVYPQQLLKPNVCPICAGRPLNRFYRGINDLYTWCMNNDRQDILDDWDYEENKHDSNTPDDPSDIARSNPKVAIHWRCHICGTPWDMVPNKRTSIDKRTLHTSGCPHCAKAGTSFSEQALFFYLSAYFPDIEHRNRRLLGKELDIYIPSKKTAVEFDGYLSHKDKLASDNEKDALCNNAGILLVRLRDSRLPKTISAINIVCNGIQDATSFEKAIKKVMQICGIQSPQDICIKHDYGRIITMFKTEFLNNSLAQAYPEIAKEWHTTKNGKLKPENFTSGEDYFAWWKCQKCGCEWQAHIYSRTTGKQGCPDCGLIQQGQTYRKNRAKKMNFFTWCHDRGKKELLEEWDYDANKKDLSCPDTPQDCPYGSPRPVHWVCKKCGYKWPAPPANRKDGKYPCPNCRGKVLHPGKNDLQTWCIENNREEILADWDYEKNIADEHCPNSPDEARFDQALYVHWKCHKCSHEWKGRIGDRTKRNKNCRDCVIKNRGKTRQ